MATERFPKRAYMKQVRAMQEDIWWWEAAYRERARNAQTESEAYPYERRAAVLEDLRYELDKVFHTLDDVPRLQ